MHAHLANLEEYGLLKRNPTKPRAIELLFDKAKQGDQRRAGCRSSGQVAAGQPVLAEENIEEYVQVPAIAGGEEGEYVLRVSGDSMRDAGILEGDYVVVRPQETAKNGDIVVALLGEEATVKRYFKETDHIRLQPENDDDGADPQHRRAGARHAWWACSGRSVAHDGRAGKERARGRTAPAPVRSRARRRASTTS